MEKMFRKFLQRCFKNRPEVGIRIYHANMKLRYERNAFKRGLLTLWSIPQAIFQSRRKRPAQASVPEKKD